MVATVRGDSERVDVMLRWAGGQATRHEVTRPVQRYEQLADHEKLIKRIDELRVEGLTLAEVAERLNQEGFRPPKRSKIFKGSMIGSLLWKRGRGERRQGCAESDLLEEHEWLLSDLARELGMPPETLHRWVRVGWVHARKLSTARGHWVIWADADELERMTRLRTCPRGWSDEPVFAQLTTLKARAQNDR